jgi:hypothetical protein
MSFRYLSRSADAFFMFREVAAEFSLPEIAALSPERPTEVAATEPEA